MATSEIHSDKVRAYRDTHYRVGFGRDAFSLRVDKLSEELLKLYQATGHQCGVYITAFNPFGRAQSEQANEEAHRRLGDHLRTVSAEVIEGVGADPTGAWPEEKSYLGLGIDLETARKLGTQARQDAVIWTGEDAIPKLILLR
jgi:hypothetical protein